MAPSAPAPAGNRLVPVPDVVLALTLAVFTTVITAFGVDDISPDDLLVDGWALTLVAATALSLAVRRRAPVAVLAVGTALTTAYLVVGYPYGPVLISFLVAVYTVARHRPPRLSAPVSAAALAVLLTHLFTNEAAISGWLGLVPGSAWVVVPYALGTTLRLTRETAERVRAEAVRQHLDDERLRIAEEVHDVVGHGLAAIQMQADIALHVGDREPGRAKAALEAISETSAAAFEELRSTLHVLRRQGDTPLAPAPGFDGLEALCDRIRTAGVDVELTVTGQRRRLPLEIDVAAHRVAQEALTNVIRHAPARKARVRVFYGDNAMSLAVTNPGPVPPPREGGSGIAGMQRRVAKAGGTLEAGPTSGGFRVVARFPIGGTS